MRTAVGESDAERAAALGRRPIGRWWQNWSDLDLRSAAIDHWARDEMTERRAWYSAVLADVFASTDARRVLDFGCGTCDDYPTLLRLGADYTGVDVTPEMLEIAQSRHPGISVDVDDVLCSRQADAQWPIVLCNAVLPHLPPEAISIAAGELHRITRTVLVVRVFGVTDADEFLQAHRGFLYVRWPVSKWASQLEADCRTVVCRHEDCATFTFWRRR